MSNYVTLVGAEQVQSAASTMRSAADEMQRAVSSMSCALEAHQRFLEQWLQEFSAVMEKKP